MAVVSTLTETTRELRARRSNLAVPGSSPKMLDKARGLAADQIFMDLEDSVAPIAKEDARKNVVAALNEGGSTAEGVVVEGELRNGTELIEQSRIEIEFLPPHSRKRAGLFFSRDPKQFELRLRPHGYEEP